MDKAAMGDTPMDKAPANNTLKITSLKDNSVLPHRATEQSAGFDLSACLDLPVTLPPGEIKLVGTGIAAAIPAGYAGFIYARSGLASKHGVALANGVGVIDSDYRGEIKVALINLSGKEYAITPGERIAQLVIMPISLMPVESVDSLDETGRGAGGFGSTGKTGNNN